MWKTRNALRDAGFIMATLKGLEPSTSCVTGRRSNQLSYSATLYFIGVSAISMVRVFRRSSPINSEKEPTFAIAL
jgi:hypothetical protein